MSDNPKGVLRGNFGPNYLDTTPYVFFLIGALNKNPVLLYLSEVIQVASLKDIRVPQTPIRVIEKSFLS